MDRVGGRQVADLAGMRSALPLPADAVTTTTTVTSTDVGAVVTADDSSPFSQLELDSKGANEPRCLSFKVLSTFYSHALFIRHANVPISATLKCRFVC